MSGVGAEFLYIKTAHYPSLTLYFVCRYLPQLNTCWIPSPLSCVLCYLAGAQYSRHAVTVSQGELDLDVDSPRSLSWDPDCSQPVVLAGAHHITDLIHSKCFNQQHSGL